MMLLRSTDRGGDPDLQIGFTPMLVSPRWTFRTEAAGDRVTFALMTPTGRRLRSPRRAWRRAIRCSSTRPTSPRTTTSTEW